MSSYSDPVFLKKRIAAAKRRAMYWSGIPSFNPTARALKQSDEKYELALCDVYSLSCILCKITGKIEPDRKAYNPKQSFAVRFSKMMGDIK